MPFHAVVAFTMGYDFLFKSILGHFERILKFVLWVFWKIEDTIISFWNFLAFKADKKNVRAWNYPGGQAVKPDPNGDANKCEFSWLMNIEFKGWLPGSIMELAMPQAQLQFVECVRKLAKTL